MINLLKETLDIITANGYTPKDISYVIVPNVKEQYSNISWDDFAEVTKDINYDNGYGIQEIANLLTIVFKDGNFLEREEYDGSEGWRYVAVPKVNEKVDTWDPKVMYIEDNYKWRLMDDED